MYGPSLPQKSTVQPNGHTSQTKPGHGLQQQCPEKTTRPAADHLAQITNWDARILAAHYSVESLAEACHVKPRRLREYIHKHMGKAPHQWMSEKRLAQAVELLSHHHSVKDTALTLQFEKITYFSTWFKHLRGVTPREFATSARQFTTTSNVPFWVVADF